LPCDEDYSLHEDAIEDIVCVWFLRTVVIFTLSYRNSLGYVVLPKGLAIGNVYASLFGIRQQKQEIGTADELSTQDVGIVDPPGGIPMPFRILVADDHEVVRRGLCALLRAQPNWEVCGEASNGREAVEQALKLKPEVLILDIGMPNLNGLEAARQVLKSNPNIKILILTLHDSDQVVREVLNAGARGFLLKSDAARDLVAAVEALRRNQTYFTPKVASMVLDGYLHRNNREVQQEITERNRLTPREREIVQLLAEGKSSKEVAVALGLSVKTAETHRSNIMRKLELHSISNLVLYAVRNNIVHVAQQPAL
jgi:DNA-binding NarL/FixJ family response regulator